ncbi:MAG TPA: SDR family NAD(P)-dependent oxidoreductase [candidate division Zixibacteria bacterium]|nr:SDR family NAD(P)-dependent oxidoreductase [candidate division Zixibacteria bacterium]
MAIVSRKTVMTGLAVSGAATAAAAVGSVLVARALWNSMRLEDFTGRTVLITGGTRGLGLALSEEFVRLGCRVAVCARDEDEVRRALTLLQRSGAQVFGAACDVSKQDEVNSFVARVNDIFGPVDVLVNNAGVIQVGPLESQTIEDFREAMDIMFYGQVYFTLAVLPQMRQRGRGNIANISSIGGKIAVPHLLPYSAAKFASAGFSEGLTAEVAKDGIRVTTVCPGLMRTGSYQNAWFKGDNEKEYAWFSLGAALPITAIDAHRAARSIVRAIRRGQVEIVLSLPAKLAAFVHGVAPGTTVRLLSLTNRLMPGTGSRSKERFRGYDSESSITRSPLTALGRKAVKRLNQKPA